MDYSGGIKDSIDKLEVRLIEYFEILKKNNNDDSQVQNIFTFANHLKNDLVLNNKEYCSHLIHSVENNFNLIRRDLVNPTKELIQNCLYALDLIKNNLEKSEENVLDLEGQTRALEKINKQLISSAELIPKITLASENNSSLNMVMEYIPRVKKDFKALIVDDEEITQNLLKNILSDFGHCEVAKDGMESVQIFKDSLQKNDPFDLICLDINMPVKDGQQTLKEIRELESTHIIDLVSRSKILMITALKDVKNKITSFKGQCDGYITKPIDYNQLINMLKKMNLIDSKNK